MSCSQSSLGCLKNTTLLGSWYYAEPTVVLRTAKILCVVNSTHPGHQSPLPPPPKRALLTVEAIWVQWIHGNLKEVWDDLRFMICCVILLEAGRWMHCAHKEMNMLSNKTQWLLNDAQVVLRGPECEAPPARTNDTRRDGSMISCCLHKMLTLQTKYCTRNGLGPGFFKSSHVWWTHASRLFCT